MRHTDLPDVSQKFGYDHHASAMLMKGQKDFRPVTKACWDVGTFRCARAASRCCPGISNTCVLLIVARCQLTVCVCARAPYLPVSICLSIRGPSKYRCALVRSRPCRNSSSNRVRDANSISVGSSSIRGTGRSTTHERLHRRSL